MIAPVLALSILVFYAAALWWLLRGESPAALAWLVGLCGISAALKVVYTTDYPYGFNDDEVKVFWCAISLLRGGHLLSEDCTGVPGLVSVLFEAQTAEIIGPSRWALRGYSMLGSVLSVPAAFAAARSLGLRVTPSLVAAGLMAVLPWSILYGRVHQSGDMVFHEMLLVAVLARFLAGRGGAVEVAIGGIPLSLLFYGYFSGRCLLGLTFVSAVLARGKYRLLCLAVALVAICGFYPYYRYSGSPWVLVGLSSTFVQGEMSEHPFGTLEAKTVQALQALARPVAFDQWLTVAAGAVHPVWLLAIAAVGAAVGALWGVRRSLFLVAGLLGGLSPAILGFSPLPSTRRMLMALPFISLAVGCAVDLIPWRRARQGLGALVFVVAGIQSVRFYFSYDFWQFNSRTVFDGDRTALMEALPLPPRPRLVLMRSFGYFAAPRSQYDRNAEILDPVNWWPPDGLPSIYAFDRPFGALQGEYRQIFGPENVRSFGAAFIVDVPANDWSWLRRFGWSYETRCYGGSTTEGSVPFLFQLGVTFPNERCGETQHVWRGRWLGPRSHLRFSYTGSVEIDTSAGRVGDSQGWEAQSDFWVDPGSDIEIRLTTPGGIELLATLVAVTSSGESIPHFEWVAPPVSSTATPNSCVVTTT